MSIEKFRFSDNPTPEQRRKEIAEWLELLEKRRRMEEYEADKKRGLVI